MSLIKFIYITAKCTFFLFIFSTNLLANENYAKINKIFLKDSHWHFKLKNVSVDNNIIKISIRYINKGTYRRPIFLSQGNSQAITKKNDDGSVTTMPVPNQDIPLALLTGKDGKTEFEAFKVEGITTNSFTNVEPKKGKNAIFYFNVNKKVKELYFISEWVTVIMRGAASVIPIKILIKLP